MAIKSYLKIEGVKGEATLTHAGEIEVLDWSWGIKQSGTAHHSTGATGGAADVHDLIVTKRIDMATPNLYKFCHQGKDLKKAVLTFMKKSGDADIEYLKITMKGPVIISSVQTAGLLPDDTFTETLGLNFASVTVEYTPQGATHAGGGAVSADIEIAK